MTEMCRDGDDIVVGLGAICRFHPRCPVAFDRCKMEGPPFDLGGGQAAARWLAEKDAVPVLDVPASSAAAPLAEAVP